MGFINKPNGQMRIYGPSQTALKYSSVDTRYASLHGLQAGADFGEVNQAPCMCPGELPNNWQAMNIRSGQNVTDLPSRFGEVKYGMRKIGPLTFIAQNDYGSWIRPKGEW